MTENKRRFQIQNVFPAAVLEKGLAHWAKSGALSLGERAQTHANAILGTFVPFASDSEKIMLDDETSFSQTIQNVT